MIGTNKFTRREFMKRTAVAGAGVALFTKYAVPSAQAFANSTRLAKWIQPLRGLGPAGIPTLNSTPDPVFPNTNYYQVTVGEFTDQLHPALPPTRLWGYWDTTNPVQRHLAGVILARRGTASRIRFTNQLPAKPIVPIDITQLMPSDGGSFDRVATHLHGGLVPWISDGGPFNWFSPTAVGTGLNNGAGLSFVNGMGSVFDNIKKQPMAAGQADYYYPNNQSARLLWYHDHAHGITRTNAYSGIATAYLILDAVNDAYVAAGKIPGLPSTIPLVFQDKIFVDPATIALTDPTWATIMKPSVQGLGSLWYAHIYDPRLYRLSNGGKTLVPPDPSCVPEFFGDTMLTNGTVYPVITVEAKRYRFLMLNACNARVLNLNLLGVAAGADVVTDPQTGFAAMGTPLGPPIIQIGNECGFLVTETTHPNGLPTNVATFTGNLLLAPAERADIIIDFTGKAGQEFMLYNDSPAPFPGGAPTNDYYLGNAHNPIQPLAGTGPDTRNVVRIKVVAAATPDPQPAGPILNPANLDPQPLVPYTTTVAPIPPLPLPANVPIRELTLNEVFDNYGRLIQMLGTTKPTIYNYGIPYADPATEQIGNGMTEIWRIYNTTADTHPIHIHLVNLQILQRQPFKFVKGLFALTGAARGPEPEEVGWKETIKMNPGEAITMIAKFDLPTGLPFAVPSSPRTGGNEYVWHCHILEHEEHDMMRPLVVF
jgi:spore coat protein A, manganese oxidase